VAIVEMLYNSNILFFVGTGRSLKDYPKNRLIVWDAEKKEIIYKLTFDCYILSVKVKNDKY